MASENVTAGKPSPERFQKRWEFVGEPKIADDLLEAAGGSQLLARLLATRGIRSGEAARAFLDPDCYTPSGCMEFPDMARAIVRITQAIENKEKIVVYGDYDADGVTSTCVMLSVLGKLGASAEFYIPNRADEGYGLNLKAVSVLASKHRAKLIISCDCGISNFSEINLAKSLGVDTIIVDHHTMPEVLPPAVAILHPRQLSEEHPLYHLSGVGVAYKLAEALLLDNNLAEEVGALLDLVALGLIADMVPLVKENRYLVQIGLNALVKSPRPGIRALLANSGGGEGSDLVGFGIAPRINAVGRLSDAGLAVRLLNCEDACEASELARKLELENARRQELCEEVFNQADQKARAALARGDRSLALYQAGWHHGVVGIVASRLVERYHCPVFIAELDEGEGKLKGSARGVPNLDLVEVLKANDNLMIRWGGHQMAAGFSADARMAESLCRSLVETCDRMLAGREATPVLTVELEPPSEAVTLSLARELVRLGPFGMGNKKPVLALKDTKVSSVRALGKEGKHHRIVVQDRDGIEFECVFWRSGGRVPESGSSIDIAFFPEVNSFQGRERLQLVLADWRTAGQEDMALDFSPPAPRESLAGGTAANHPSREPVVRLETRYDGVIAATGPAGNWSTAPMSGDSATRSWPASPTQQASPLSASSGAAALAGQILPLEEEEARELSAGDPVQDWLRSCLHKITWKDLRERPAPESVVEAAVRNLKERVVIFGEACPELSCAPLVDRVELSASGHLLLWQFPPTADVFRGLIARTRASTVYLLGAAPVVEWDGNTFLKRLLGIVRYAVNQRGGEAQTDKVAAALSTSKVAIALGLLILRKLDVVEWYAEEGTLYLDMMEAPSGSWSELPEFRQLQACLDEVSDFRKWCSEAPLDEIQLALVPNAIRMGSAETDGSSPGANDGRDYDDRTTFISSAD